MNTLILPDRADAPNDSMAMLIERNRWLLAKAAEARRSCLEAEVRARSRLLLAQEAFERAEQRRRTTRPAREMR